MDHAAYHVIYVDKRVSQDLDGKHLQKSGPDVSKIRKRGSWVDRKPDCFDIILTEDAEVRNNLKSILATFDGVYPCASSSTCMARLVQLESVNANLQPTLVIMETIVEIEVDARRAPGSLASTFPALNSTLPSTGHNLSSTVTDPEDHYGLTLLQHITSEISDLKLSTLVVPIAMVHNWEINTTLGSGGPINRPSRPYSGGLDMPGESSSPSSPKDLTFIAPTVNPRRLQKCLDAGAIDVLVSPLQPDRVYGLTAHAYRARNHASKERTELLAANRVRKRSWVGLDNHAYMLEDMVSELVAGICNPDHISHGFNAGSLYNMDHSETTSLATAIGTWGFSAHEYSEEQLVEAAFLMLNHALAVPELEKWRLPAGKFFDHTRNHGNLQGPTDEIPAADLENFILASRAAYNSFVHYHNFRHVVDVMQAIFYFLLRLGTIPPYPASRDSPDTNKPVSPVAALLKPIDALTLLISAIGHDVGHPGVNNAFLVALKAPLAQLYNDKSVLESFHCAAYSQILRRYWKQAFEDVSMRGLMINSILATDMGLHFKYMSDLKDLTEAIGNKGTEGLNSQKLDEYRLLVCALLVKCADISNVARPFDIAAKWADILQLEFANQGDMETKIGVPTTLFGGPPELGNLIKLANSQIGFMAIFARPLFEGLTKILPTMDFAVDEMKANHEIWDEKIQQRNLMVETRTGRGKTLSEDSFPPRSDSPSRSFNQPEFSHPEGLPASRVTPDASRPSESPRKLEQNGETSLALRTPDATTGETPDMSPQSQSQSSRRSSLGLPPGYVSSGPGSTSYSRRSSGAYPAANPIAPITSTRRSSNTVPSQLQLGPAINMRSSTSVSTDENVQPGGHGPEDTLRKSNAVNAAYTPHPDGGHGAGGDPTHREYRGSDTYNHRSARYTANSSTGHFSPLPSHNRYSSGAQTSITHSQPYSPTETQATSVLTVDNDDRSFHTGGGRSSPTHKGTQSAVDVERLGSGHESVNSEPNNGSDVKNAATNGHAGAMSSGDNGHRPVARRKSSRFLTFWKKMGKAVDASP